MTKKISLPEIEAGPFLKVYDAAVAAQLDMREVRGLIEAALAKKHGITRPQARLAWASHLIRERPLN